MEQLFTVELTFEEIEIMVAVLHSHFSRLIESHRATNAEEEKLKRVSAAIQQLLNALENQAQIPE